MFCSVHYQISLISFLNIEHTWFFCILDEEQEKQKGRLVVE
jgi:hypothetical protein